MSGFPCATSLAEQATHQIVLEPAELQVLVKGFIKLLDRVLELVDRHPIQLRRELLESERDLHQLQNEIFQKGVLT